MSNQGECETTPCDENQPLSLVRRSSREAARFYTRIFEDSKITAIPRYPEAGQEIHGKPPGSVMTVAFELNGQSFTALNGGPIFKFNEAVSSSASRTYQESAWYCQSARVRCAALWDTTKAKTTSRSASGAAKRRNASRLRRAPPRRLRSKRTLRERRPHRSSAASGAAQSCRTRRAKTLP